MVERTAMENTGSVGGYMKLYDAFIKKFAAIFLVVFLWMLASILLNRHETAYRNELRQYFEQSVKCFRGHLTAYDTKLAKELGPGYT